MGFGPGLWEMSMFWNTARKAFVLGLLLPLIAVPSAAVAQGDSRDAVSPEFRAWVDARAGTGQPVHWVAEGGVYEYPSGRKLFGMVGFDSSRVIWPGRPGDPVIHLTRKTFAYTDPQTGEVLREYNGQPVTPVAYPYQMITYRQDGAQIFADVEQGAGRAVQTIKARDGIRYRWIGADTLAVTAPIFLDFPLPGGARYEAWENYDFFIHQGGKVAEPHQMSWQRFGSLPPWAGKGKAIYHLLSWRVEDQNQFPPMILAWAKAAMPMWLIPPADVAEVRKLQQGEAVEGWAK
jgi:hypothetical protein